MAIYQPTNITPSSFAGIGGGVVDATESISISWQVNGNSPMTGFTVTVYANSDDGDVLHSADVTLPAPFYGTDALGNPSYYVYEPGVVWSSWGLANGNGYKMKIGQRWESGGETVTVEQNTETFFLARTKPTLSISAPTGGISSVSHTFTATYAQAQGDPLSWVRWVLTDVEGNTADDTGVLYTQLLSYTYSRFMSGQNYTLVCTAETSNGVLASSAVSFAVSYDSAASALVMETVCNADDSVTLNWNAATSSPGAASPATGWGTASGGVLTLNSGASVSWSEVDGEPISVSAPYAVGWRGVLGTVGSVSRSGSISVAPDTVPEKTYPGTETRTLTLSPPSMEWADQPDIPSSAVLSIPLTSANAVSLTQAIDCTPSKPYELGGKLVISSDKFSYRGVKTSHVTEGFRGDFYIEWTSYVKPSGCRITRNGSNYPNHLGHDIIVNYDFGSSNDPNFTSTATTDADGTPCWFNSLHANVIEYNDTGWPVTAFVYVPISFQVDYSYYKRTFSYTEPEAGSSGFYIASADDALLFRDSSFFTPAETTSVTDNGDGTCSGIAVAAQAGTYSLTVGYQYTFDRVGAYRGVLRANLNDQIAFPATVIPGKYVLIGAEVLSTTAETSATVEVDGDNAQGSNYYTVTFYSETDDIPQASVQFLLNSPVTGSDSFRETLRVTLPENCIGGIQTVTTSADGGYLVRGVGVRTYDIEFLHNESAAVTYTYTFDQIFYPAVNRLISLGSSSPFTVSVAGTSGALRTTATFAKNGTSVWTATLPVNAWTAVFVLRRYANGSERYQVYTWDRSGGQLTTYARNFSASSMPNPLSRVTLNGPQTANWLTVTQNVDLDFVSSATPPFTKETVLYARFEDGLEAGTLAAGSALGLSIFREENGRLIPVGVFGTTITSITDYGIRSGVPFRYYGYYVTNGIYSSASATAEMCRRFRQFTLIEAEEDGEAAQTYHPVNVWRFNANFDGGTYSTNAAPALFQNFTKYPLWQATSPAARTGTLTAYLSRTANGQYLAEDTAAAMEKLNALTSSVNPLFLRDLKGNLFMVRLAAAISQTVDWKNAALPVTVSVPWVEVGDASDVCIYTVGDTEG